MPDESAGDLADAVRAVQHRDVRSRETGRRLLDDLGQLVDQHPVQRHPVVRRRGLGLNLHLLGVGHGQDADSLRLGLRRLDHFGDELLLAQFGLTLGQLGLGSDDTALGLRLRQWSGLRGLGLRGVNLGAVLGLHDGRLPGVLGLVALGDLLGLGRGLVCLRLRDLRLPLDGGVVRRGDRQDVAELAVVDRLDLQRVDGQSDPGHLLLGAVQHLDSELLPLLDDLLDGQGTDDRPQVAGEDPSGQHRHLVLVGEEALAGVDDAFRVVADLEGDDRAHV